MRRTLVLIGCAVVGVPLCTSCGDQDTTGPWDIHMTPASILAGSDTCFDGVKRVSTDTEAYRLGMSLELHADAMCLDNEYGSGTFWELQDHTFSGQIGVDAEVMDRCEAAGYWIPKSLRHQYNGLRIYMDQRYVDANVGRDQAMILVHEWAHENGADEEGARKIASDCTFY